MGDAMRTFGALILAMFGLCCVAGAAWADCEGVPGPMCPQLSAREVRAVMVYRGCLLESPLDHMAAERVGMPIWDYCETKRRVALALGSDDVAKNGPANRVLDEIQRAAMNGIWLCGRRQIPGCGAN
jgi:hypothetical protein